MPESRHDEPEALPALRPAAFLDRDGTIIVEREYLADPEEVELIPGAVEGLSALRRAGHALVVVTNQSGIARGFYGVEAFLTVQRRVDELLSAAGTPLDGMYFCPHHPDVTGPCECRKPGVALYRRAAGELSLELTTSLYIGDKRSDLEPAVALGGTPILVRSGYGAGVAGEGKLPNGTVVLDDLAAVGAWLTGWRGE